MTLAALLSLAVVGFGVGLLAGLIGIGGGVLIVPFLYFFYAHAAWSGITLSPALHATVAHATSLFIIVPTALMGTAEYSRTRMVVWPAVLPVALPSAIAAVGGVFIASRVPAEVLKVTFGVFLLFTAIQLVVRRVTAEARPLRVNMKTAGITGLVVGVLSALLGVGGGIVAIPLLLHLLHVDIERVAATSLAIVAAAATAGMITYIMVGQTATGLPAGHLGYVHVWAALPMMPGALIAVRWGAKLNQRLNARRLRLLFAGVITILGLRLVLSNLASLL
jgi:uncharacterized membrane protein YfcA